MSNLIQRILTGLIFLAVIIAAILIDPLTLALVFLIVGLITLREFYAMVKAAGYKPQSEMGILVGFISYSLIALLKFELVTTSYLTLIIPLLVLLFIAELYNESEKPFTHIALTILGVFYCMMPFALLNLMIFIDPETGYSPAIVMGYFILIWVNDTGAYVAGRTLGKHKFFPRISPNKTWEGFVGGGIFTLAAAYVVSIYFTRLNLWEWMGLATIVVVFGSYGDLVESMLKRSLKLKDSGKWLPGHGGFLDRFDGVLLSSPIVFTYLVIFVY